MVNKSKILKTSLLVLFLLFSCLRLDAKSIEVVNDQELAKQLSKSEVSWDEASGWDKDKSIIYTTIFQKDGTYRGYRISQLQKDGNADDLVKQYREDAKNVCSISEVKTIQAQYDGSSRNGVDVICMQSVGNEGVASISNDELTISSGYGKTNGYLVGIKVVNSSFDNINGAKLSANDVLYITSNDGGSASIIASQANDHKGTNTNNIDIKSIIIIAGIGAIFILIIVLVVWLIRKLFKSKNKSKADQVGVDPNKVNHQPTFAKQPQPPVEPPVEKAEQKPEQPIIPDGFGVVDSGEVEKYD